MKQAISGLPVIINQIQAIDNPLLRKALFCVVHHLGVSKAEKIVLGWQLLGVWNLEDPRLDVIIKALKGKEVYKKYNFLVGYEQELLKSQSELHELQEIQQSFKKLNEDTDDVSELIKLVQQRGGGTTIRDMQRLFESNYWNVFGDLETKIKMLEKHINILKERNSSYTESISTILSKKISGISPRLLRYVTGKDNLPYSPERLYYWQKSSAGDLGMFDHLMTDALRYADTNVSDYIIEEMVEKYFGDKWSEIYDTYKNDIFHRADHLCKQFEAHNGEGYGFKEILTKVDNVTSKLSFDDKVLENIDYILTDYQQARVSKSPAPKIVAVFNSKISRSQVDPEENIGAYFADTSKSPITTSQIDTIIIPHTDNTDFSIKLAWLMKRLGFSKEQIEKAPILASFNLNYMTDLADV